MRAASRKRKRCSKRGDARAKPAARPGELEAANGRKGRSVRPRRKPKPLPLSGLSGNEGPRPVDAKEATAGSNVRRGFEGGPAEASAFVGHPIGSSGIARSQETDPPGSRKGSPRGRPIGDQESGGWRQRQPPLLCAMATDALPTPKPPNPHPSACRPAAPPVPSIRQCDERGSPSKGWKWVIGSTQPGASRRVVPTVAIFFT